jgi:hypothetical protein
MGAMQFCGKSQWIFLRISRRLSLKAADLKRLNVIHGKLLAR